MTDSELRRRANERLDAWLRDDDKREAQNRLEALVDDVVETISGYTYCGDCGTGLAWKCPECGVNEVETKAVVEALDAVREEIDRQVDLFYMAS